MTKEERMGWQETMEKFTRFSRQLKEDPYAERSLVASVIKGGNNEIEDGINWGWGVNQNETNQIVILRQEKGPGRASLIFKRRILINDFLHQSSLDMTIYVNYSSNWSLVQEAPLRLTISSSGMQKLKELINSNGVSRGTVVNLY